MKYCLAIFGGELLLGNMLAIVAGHGLSAGAFVIHIVENVS